ncbi:MAG TPA: zinc-binding dehydrogenase [Acidimicrobiales bacterium]|nr:zinc-binding dehydrogenase [Acidimicrobiales bacterium]
MRAAVLRGGRVEIRETPDPVPGPGELLVRTLSTAICASDVHFMDHHDAVPAGGPAGMLYDADRDIVLGHEFVGEVVAHGPDCAGTFPAGTRVTAMPILLVDGGLAGTKVIGQHPEAPGSFGEMLLVAEPMARAVPDGVDPDAVALVDAFAVGEFYVRSSAIAPGEVPLVIGAGAIGLSTVAALAARSIEPIVVSDLDAGRRALAERFGAHVTVDPTSRSPWDVWKDVAAERGTTRPAVVFECVGKPGMVQHIVDSAEMWARVYAAGGWYTGDQLDCTAATHKGVTIQFGGGPHPEDWYGTLDAVCAGRLDPLPSVGDVIGLDQVPDALERVRRGEGPPRIVVHPHS